jgi:hypothetical protein
MKTMLALCALLGLSAVLAQQTPVYIPMLYATPAPIDNTNAFTTTQFILNFCKNAAYDGKTLEVAANLPYKPWSVSMGQIVNIGVYNNPDCTGSPLAANVDSTGAPVPKFDVVYNVSWGDLYLKVTTGASPNVVYTLSGSFGEAFGGTRRRAPITHGGPSNGSYAGKTIAGGSGPVTLTQIVNDFQPFQVLTGDLILINFAYCPPSSLQNYDISIAATAVNDLSAAALYICTKQSEMPCSPGSAEQDHMDPSGTAVASVRLSATTQQFTQMQAAVVGWGAYNLPNSFLFTVSVDTHGVYSSM